MFNWKLFLLLVALCFPGILVTVPRSLDAIMRRIDGGMPPGKKLPARPVLLLAASLQSIALVSLFAALGVFTAPRVGFSAPFFEAVIDMKGVWAALRPQLLPTFWLSSVGAGVFLLSYYGYFRPRIDNQTVRCMEGMRHDLGVAARLLYGGIVEEVLTRWGLLTPLVWLGTLLTGKPSPLVVWTAIVVAGVLFGIGHLPSYLAAGCKRTPIFIAAMIWLNLWASLVFGWLYWQVGLAAAMLAHMLFHLFWLPFDHKFSYSNPSIET